MLETLPKITIKRTFNVICSIYHLMWMLRLISLVIAYNPISIIARRHTLKHEYPFTMFGLWKILRKENVLKNIFLIFSFMMKNKKKIKYNYN